MPPLPKLTPIMTDAQVPRYCEICHANAVDIPVPPTNDKNPDTNSMGSKTDTFEQQHAPGQEKHDGSLVGLKDERMNIHLGSRFTGDNSVTIRTPM
jgi:hypothetical protein